jgi:ribosomal protein S18 acetylase RimI-like enzyme
MEATQNPEILTESISIRRATSADAGTVHALMCEIAAEEGQSDAVRITEQRCEALLGRADVVVLLAEEGPACVGYVSAVRQLHLWTGGDILALDDLYVRPGHRDAGIGRRLMTSMAQHPVAAGLLIRWGLEPDNESAARFYRRLGASLRPKVIATWSPRVYAAASTNLG